MKAVDEFCLNIEALDGKTRFTLDQLLTTESLPIRGKNFAGNKELRRWPHHDLHLHVIWSVKSIDITPIVKINKISK